MQIYGKSPENPAVSIFSFFKYNAKWFGHLCFLSSLNLFMHSIWSRKRSFENHKCWGAIYVFVEREGVHLNRFLFIWLAFDLSIEVLQFTPRFVFLGCLKQHMKPYKSYHQQFIKNKTYFLPTKFEQKIAYVNKLVDITVIVYCREMLTLKMFDIS